MLCSDLPIPPSVLFLCSDPTQDARHVTLYAPAVLRRARFDGGNSFKELVRGFAHCPSLPFCLPFSAWFARSWGFGEDGRRGEVAWSSQRDSRSRRELSPVMPVAPPTGPTADGRVCTGLWAVRSLVFHPPRSPLRWESRGAAHSQGPGSQTPPPPEGTVCLNPGCILCGRLVSAPAGASLQRSPFQRALGGLGDQGATQCRVLRSLAQTVAASSAPASCRLLPSGWFGDFFFSTSSLGGTAGCSAPATASLRILPESASPFSWEAWPVPWSRPGELRSDSQARGLRWLTAEPARGSPSTWPSSLLLLFVPFSRACVSWVPPPRGRSSSSECMCVSWGALRVNYF